MTAHPTPEHLKAPGRALWEQITAQLEDDGLELDALERRILSDACDAADELDRITAALDGAPVEVLGSTGQPVPNKLFDEARKTRAQIAALLKQLDLRDPARPERRGSATTSSTARAAAQVRWAAPRGA